MLRRISLVLWVTFMAIVTARGLWLLTIVGALVFVVWLFTLRRARGSRRAARPTAPPAEHPRRRLQQGFWTYDKADLATVPLRDDQAGAVEDGEVLDHRRAAHGQLGGQGGRRAMPVLRQQVEDPTPGRVRERGEDVLGHTVTVCA